MAPMAPVGKEGALRELRAGRGAWLGSPHPTVAILEQDGVWRIRQLVVDPEDESREHQRSMREKGMWMPEQYFALGKPTGQIFVEAPTRDAMITAVEQMDWPHDW